MKSSAATALLIDATRVQRDAIAVMTALRGYGGLNFSTACKVLRDFGDIYPEWAKLVKIASVVPVSSMPRIKTAQQSRLGESKYTYIFSFFLQKRDFTLSLTPRLSRGQDRLSAVVEQRMRMKLYSVLVNNKHPLHNILAGQRSSCSERLISLHCRTERFRRSFVPTAIRLFNSDC